MMPVMQFVGNLGYVGVCVAGGILLLTEHFKLGIFNHLRNMSNYLRNQFPA